MRTEAEIQASYKSLTDEYQGYCNKHQLPEMSADELIHHPQGWEHRIYLEGFIARWEAVEAEERAIRFQESIAAEAEAARVRNEAAFSQAEQLGSTVDGVENIALTAALDVIAHCDDDIDRSTLLLALAQGGEMAQHRGVNPIDRLSDAAGYQLMVELVAVRNQFSKAIEDHSDAIQRGASALQFNSQLDADISAWDMRQIATVGYNLGKEQTIDGSVYVFNQDENYWESGDSCLDFDPQTGLPTTERS